MIMFNLTYNRNEIVFHGENTMCASVPSQSQHAMSKLLAQNETRRTTPTPKRGGKRKYIDIMCLYVVELKLKFTQLFPVAFNGFPDILLILVHFIRFFDFPLRCAFPRNEVLSDHIELTTAKRFARHLSPSLQRKTYEIIHKPILEKIPHHPSFPSVKLLVS